MQPTRPSKHTSTTIEVPERPWRSGLSLGLSHWLHPKVPAQPRQPRFLTLSTPGQLGGDQLFPDWQLNLNLPDEFTDAETELFHHGFRLVAGAQRLYAAVTPQGSLLIECPEGIRPSLHGLETAVHTTERGELLEGPTYSALLEELTAEEGARFLLRLIPTSEDPPAQEIPSSSAREDLLAVRLKLTDFFGRAEGQFIDGTTREAAERCAAALRGPTPHWPGLWLADSEETWSSADLYLAVSTWLELDHTIASALLQAPLEYMEQHQNTLPHTVDVWNGGGSEQTAWPVLAQLLEMVDQVDREMQRASTWIQEAAQHLHRSLYRDEEVLSTAYEDSMTAPVPRDLVPDAEGIDGMALALAEAEAIARLTHDDAETSASWNQIAQALRNRIESVHWDESAYWYVDAPEESAEARTPSPHLGGALILMAEASGLSHQAELFAALQDRPWATNYGLAVRPDEPAADPLTRIRLCNMLLHAATSDRRLLVHDQWVVQWRAAAAEEVIGLEESDTPVIAWQSAAWLIGLDYPGISSGIHLKPHSKTLLALDRRKYTLATAMGLLFFIGLVTIALLVHQRGTLPSSSQYAFDILVRHLYGNAQHERGIELVNSIIPKTGDPKLRANYRLMVGNMHFREGDFEQARDNYETMMDVDQIELSVKASYNRGIALFKMGRYEQARDAFHAFILEYEEDFPALRDRALHAIELTEEQLQQQRQLENDPS